MNSAQHLPLGWGAGGGRFLPLELSLRALRLPSTGASRSLGQSCGVFCHLGLVAGRNTGVPGPSLGGGLHWLSMYRQGRGTQERLAPQSDGDGSESMMVSLTSLRPRLLDRTQPICSNRKGGTLTGGNKL